ARRQRAASRTRRLQPRGRIPLQPHDRKRGLHRQVAGRAAAAGPCRTGRLAREPSPCSLHHRPGAPAMIEQVVTPVTHDLGAFKVRRSLPARERTMVGPFIFVDQFGPAQMVPGEGMDVRPHPHINLATVTYLFDGAIQHKDSIGSHKVIEPGAINLMTAGKGIVHSERSPQALRPDGPSLCGMQTWLALPDGKEEIDPTFDHVPANGLAVVDTTGRPPSVLMGTLWGAAAATPCHSQTIYADIELDGGAVPI